MVRNLVGVVISDKSVNKKQGFLIEVEVSNNLGVIKFAGPDVKDLKVGNTVYFGNARETITMQGQEVMIMEESNIVAILEDEEKHEESKANKSAENKSSI